MSWYGALSATFNMAFWVIAKNNRRVGDPGYDYE